MNGSTQQKYKPVLTRLVDTERLSPYGPNHRPLRRGTGTEARRSLRSRLRKGGSESHRGGHPLVAKAASN